MARPDLTTKFTAKESSHEIRSRRPLGHGTHLKGCSGHAYGFLDWDSTVQAEEVEDMFAMPGKHRARSYDHPKKYQRHAPTWFPWTPSNEYLLVVNYKRVRFPSYKHISRNITAQQTTQHFMRDVLLYDYPTTTENKEF